MVDHGRKVQHQFGSPAAGAKTNDIIAKPCTVHFVSAYISCPPAMLFLISLVASFVFHVLESSLNWFFTLTYIREKKE